jgi:hypothetical protein
MMGLLWRRTLLEPAVEVLLLGLLVLLFLVLFLEWRKL